MVITGDCEYYLRMRCRNYDSTSTFDQGSSWTTATSTCSDPQGYEDCEVTGYITITSYRDPYIESFEKKVETTLKQMRARYWARLHLIVPRPRPQNVRMPDPIPLKRARKVIPYRMLFSKSGYIPMKTRYKKKSNRRRR